MPSTWNPTKFNMTVGAVTVVQFANGAFIKAMFNEDQWTLEMGADGNGARIRNANESGRFEITLLRSSPTNDELAALSLLDRETGQGIVAIQVKDGSNTQAGAVASCAGGWVVKQPDFERQKTLGDVTWVFETDKLTMVQGGTE